MKRRPTVYVMLLLTQHAVRPGMSSATRMRLGPAGRWRSSLHDTAAASLGGHFVGSRVTQQSALESINALYVRVQTASTVSQRVSYHTLLQHTVLLSGRLGN